MRVLMEIVALTQRAAVRVPARDERGQATAEYALIIVAAAMIGTVVIAWAVDNGRLATLFNLVIERVMSAVR